MVCVYSGSDSSSLFTNIREGDGMGDDGRVVWNGGNMYRNGVCDRRGE